MSTCDLVSEWVTRSPMDLSWNAKKNMKSFTPARHPFCDCLLVHLAIPINLVCRSCVEETIIEKNISLGNRYHHSWIMILSSAWHRTKHRTYPPVVGPARTIVSKSSRIKQISEITPDIWHLFCIKGINSLQSDESKFVFFTRRQKEERLQGILCPYSVSEETQNKKGTKSKRALPRKI